MQCFMVLLNKQMILQNLFISKKHTVEEMKLKMYMEDSKKLQNLTFLNIQIQLFFFFIFQYYIYQSFISLLVTFLFAESPTHGQQYHDLDDDNLMEDIPQGQLETLMQRYRELKLNNFFVCARITKKTDKMYDIMKQNFPELTISDNIRPEDFSNLVQFTLRSSLTRKTQFQTQKQLEINAKSWKTKFMPYYANKLQEKVLFWKSFEVNLQKYLRDCKTVLKINQDPENFGENELFITSKILKAFDVKNNQNLVIKIPAQIIKEFQTNKCLKQKTKEQYQKFVQSKFIAQAFAKQMAQVYRLKSQQMDGAAPTFFVTPMMYNLQEPFYGLDSLYAETFINLPNISWTKYSNNGQFIDSKNYFYSAFTHFSYEESGQQFVITDLQGKLNILSDPSIQTQQNFSQILSFDNTNFQNQGIGQFLFAQHTQCSIICKQLCLSNKDNLGNVYQEAIWTLNETSELPIICETCDEYQQIKLQEYKDGLHKMCKQCQDLEQIKTYNQCQCCFQQYELPLNLSVRIGTNISKCNDCKVQCGGFVINCIYCNVKCKLKLTQQKIQGKEQNICINGKKFLASLKCRKCNEFYQFENS